MVENQTALARRENGGLDLSSYDPKACNILTPSLLYDSAAPFLRYRAIEVRIEADHEKGDCYAAPGSHWIEVAGRRVPAKLSPAKPGLLKIAAASGLITDPIHSCRIRPDTCDRCIALAASHRQAMRCGDCPARFNTAYRYIGAIRSETGWRILSATYEWDLDAQERKIRQQGRKKQKTYEEALVKFQTGEYRREPDLFDYEEYVQERIDHVVSERYGLAETKALLRLVRAICFMRQVYTREEMALPFVVVKTELAPDFDDPEVRRALAQQATLSAPTLFATGTDRPIDAAFKEHLEHAPDFERTADQAEVVAAAVEDDDVAAAGGAEAGQMFPTEEGSAGGPGPQEAKATGPDPVACVSCDKPLTRGRQAWCESEAGKQAVGGRNICFSCQEAEAKGDGE